MSNPYSAQRPQPLNPPNGQSPDVVDQVKDFWQKIGIFTKIIVLVNVVSYCLQQYFDVSYEYLSMCLVPVADSLQFYRYFTSEFTHGNLAHIASNMLIFLLYGWEVEKTYGSLFYASLNFLIMALSNSLNILFVWLLAFVWPYSLGGGISHLAVCSVGYSNIIFGLMMVFAFQGDNRYQKLLGVVSVKKIYMPWILMIIIQLVMPNASLLGHLCGIIAALLIKFCGLYVLMPSYEWIKDFDDSYASGLERKVTYFKGTEAISVDFKSQFWLGIARFFKRTISKIRGRICGHQESGQQHHQMAIGSHSIEFTQYNMGEP